ncbi:DEAD/DEAH box helicase [Puniceicoccaceae bacterium K14]|nr:DEAD/DEAH box helicase [Puniceicoccaceae bacterium K14]
MIILEPEISMLELGQFEARLKIPDMWQQEALKLVTAGKDVVVNAPTGAGKTYLVELLAEKNKVGQIIHSVPTRALANDKAREWSAKGWRVGIVTGDVSSDPNAPLVVATLETQKGRFIHGEGPSIFVIDEYQMLGDSVRGVNYEVAIASAPMDTRLLLLSGSVSNPGEVVDWLKRIGRDASLVSTDERPVPLEEVFVDSLASVPPRSVRGFWPRVAAKVLMSDLGPLLMFAPRRKEAERLARQIAGALPCENPLGLSQQQKKLAGGELSKLLNKRIAFHHSGLSYQQRAGLVEPLAKSGQLRIVVSTTGLAAGVNFSMRSVVVTEGEYWSGHVLNPLGSDEILQMFGRAGRRGLDDRGFALSLSDKPRLSDGRKLPVKRVGLLDWPSLIGAMSLYAKRGMDPFNAAHSLCSRLYQPNDIRLGVEFSQRSPDAPCGIGIDKLRHEFSKPVHDQMLNSLGEWQSVPAESVKLPLRNVKANSGGKYVDFLSDPESVRRLGEGGLHKFKSKKGKRFGKKFVIGYPQKGEKERWRLTGWFSSRLACALNIECELLPRTFEQEDLKRYGTDLLSSVLGLGRYSRMLVDRGKLLMVVDLRDHERECYIGTDGLGYVNPIRRKVYSESCKACSHFSECSDDIYNRSSPAFSWRKLGLISDSGKPTLRGQIFSFFQNGEGLAIAAALEDLSYSVDAIAQDLANVRAGFRFDDYTEYSHRLARACRSSFGDQSYPGYLDHGLPPNYGDGAAEVVTAYYHEKSKGKHLLSDLLRQGDLQRVRLEWLSLLKQISRAQDLEWDRWRELKETVDKILQTDDVKLHLKELPGLEPGQTGKVSHKLYFPRV